MKTKLFKWMNVVIVTMFIGSLTACNSDEGFVLSEVSEDVVVSNIETSNDPKTSLKTRALSDWKIVEFDQSAVLLQHKDKPSWYVAMFDLNKINLRLVYKVVSGETLGQDPFLVRKEIEDWNKHYYGVKALFNTSFFLYKHKIWGEGLWGGKAKLAHFLADNGTVITYGYEDCNTSDIRYLNIYSNYATIENCTPNACPSPTYATGKGVVVGGFSPYYKIDATKSIGRTMLGIKDSDGNGKCESVYVFVAKHSSGATQAEARKVISQDFGCSSMIMFDGSASSCLAWDGKVKVKGTDYWLDDRNIPVLLKAIKK